MLEHPTIVETTALPAAIIHITVPRDAIRDAMGPGFQELMTTIAAQGITPSGPWFTHHLRMDPEVFDFELGVPVTARVAPAGRVVPGQLPAARVARTVYVGSYEGLGDAWAEFDTWMQGAGHTPTADLWEQYLVGPETSPDPSSWRTELNRPLAG